MSKHHKTQSYRMVFRKLISAEQRAYARLLREQGLSYRTIAKKAKISRMSALRICKGPLPSNKAKKRGKGGRKRLLTQRQERILVRNIKVLRKTEGPFSCKRLMEFSGVHNVSERTVRRYLNRNGFYFLQARKKGLMTETDFKKRTRFAKNIRNNYPRNVFTDRVAFYLDGTGFAFKTNPMDQARAPRSRIWRRKSEGLDAGCTAKGAKVGSGGKVLRLMVAISYNEGVVICEQYEHMNGPYFANFIRTHFEAMFSRADKSGSRIFIQDGDPSQNSALATNAMQEVNAELLLIPPRSPDLNPIENIFKIVGDDLRKQALDHKIRSETFDEFTA